MKKSFKKIISVLLSVLMIACAIPFSAFAADDVKPNVDLQFNAFSYAQANKAIHTNYTTAMRGTNVNMSTLGIGNVPLDYDKNAGTLTLKAAKAQPLISSKKASAMTDDYTYGVGDYFTVTVRLDNVSKIAAAQVALKYSDNIEPAGLYHKNNANNLVWYSISENITPVTGNYADVARAGYPIPSQSAAELYAGLNDGIVGDASYIDDATNTIYTYVSNQDGNASTSVASVADGSAFTNADGTLGNTYANKAILATYAFKIMKAGAITFSLADSNSVDDCYYLADEADGTTSAAYKTYAQTNEAGSTGVTFMGKNEFVAGSSYSVVFKNADGSVISEATYNEGASVTVPDLPTKAADSEYHYSYAWDKTPASTATEDAVYMAVETATKHTMSEEIIKDATTTETGTKKLTCDICGYSTTETIPVKTCNHTNTTTSEEVVKAATCKEAGSKIVKVTCTDCGTVISTETVAIPKTAHKFGEYVYNGDAEYTSASVYKDGTETATCSICGEKDTKSVAGTGLLRARVANAEFGGEIKMCIGTRTAQVNAFDEVYCVFTREDGQSFTIPAEDSYVSGQNTFFDFGVTPQGLNSPVTIVYYGVRGGKTYWGPTYEYNMVTSYVLKQLTNANSSETWKNFLVELMYYGYANQVYSGWDLEHPMIDLLTADQKARHSTEPLILNKYQNTSYIVCENALTKWRSVNMIFGAATKIQFRTQALALTDDISAKIEIEGESTPYEYEYSDPDDAEYFVEDGAGGIYFTFADLPVKRLRSKIYVTLYKNGTPIINTFEYSAETYANGRATTSKEYPLTQQQMRYANAARAYFGVN